MEDSIRTDPIILHYHEDEQLIRARILILDKQTLRYNDFAIDVNYDFSSNANEGGIRTSVRNNLPYERLLLSCTVEDLDEYQELVGVCEKNKPLVAIYALYCLYGFDISPEVANELSERGFPIYEE